MTFRQLPAYISDVIKSFKNKELAALWNGERTRIDRRLHRRILVRLDQLNVCSLPEEMNLPGFNFHSLSGSNPTRFTVHINGPWCITFAFDDGDACAVDLEQYH